MFAGRIFAVCALAIAGGAAATAETRPVEAGMQILAQDFVDKITSRTDTDEAKRIFVATPKSEERGFACQPLSDLLETEFGTAFEAALGEKRPEVRIVERQTPRTADLTVVLSWSRDGAAAFDLNIKVGETAEDGSEPRFFTGSVALAQDDLRPAHRSCLARMRTM